MMQELHNAMPTEGQESILIRICHDDRIVVDESFHDRLACRPFQKRFAKGRQRHGGLGRGKLLLPELFLTQIGLAQAGNQGQ